MVALSRPPFELLVIIGELTEPYSGPTIQHTNFGHSLGFADAIQNS
ncbi:hypothetical protein C7374_11148 [Falsochrobactrum ovis]|uniref:Uncharacterized protein n=1 Tax=Falsochrobactrum ovis TaxID=1293442 RepID=A0A364JTE7_9HYPH|nr:hypothetical protein C7374_11148 [Falsochrobactrum ovis]